MMPIQKRIVLWFPVLLPLYVLRLSFGPLPTTVLELAFGCVTVLVTALSGWNIWKIGFQKTRAWHVPAGLWILATLIAVFIAPHWFSGLGLWRAYVLEPIAYALLLAAYLNTDEDRTTVLRALITSVFIVTLFAVAQFITGRWIPHPWNTDILTRRATGPFPFPNALALFSAPIAAVCFGKILNQKGDHQTFLWLGFFAATVSTLLAKSVGGFIGICAAVFVGLVSWKKTRVATLIASALVIISILIVPQLRQPVVKTLSFHQWSGQVRTIIWKETVNMLKDHAVFGAGFGAYPEVIKPYHTATYLEIFQYPHNILLNLWSETGLIGILAFAWIVGVWVKLSRAEVASTRFYVLLPLIAILVQGLVDVPYFKNDLSFQFWILAMLI